jgi:DNA-directed RNA polymerase subunit RPC12/RpoP
VQASSLNRRHVFPCQQCGAQLTFVPGTDEMGCDHCGHSHTISFSLEPIAEYDFHSAVKNLAKPSGDKTIITVDCHVCSAMFEFAPSLHSDECPFCGSAIVVETTEHKQIQPESLLPFEITQNQAVEHYKSWLKKLWFAPSKLKRLARKGRKLNGVYVPYWTYDSFTESRYNGLRGTAYQVPKNVSVIVNGKRTTQIRMVTKIKWRPISGRVQRNFNDILIYATDSLPRSMARELAPWDLGNLKPYQEEYLSGFQSEMYKTQLDQGYEIAKKRMHTVIRQDIRNDIGGDRQQIQGIDTQYSQIRFKHILVPFWIAGFRFRNKTYQFIVNGRTGEVQGNRPYSWLKIGAAAISLGLLIILAAYYAHLSGYAEELLYNVN